MSYRNPVRAVGVVGTVTTTSTGGGGTTTPTGPTTKAAFRGSRDASAGSNYVNCATPASCAEGDLLVAYLVGRSRSPTGGPGWSTAWASATNDNSFNVGLLSRVATAEDAAGGKTYSFGNFGISGSGIAGTVLLLAFSGATGIATDTVRDLQTAGNNGGNESAATNIPANVSNGHSLVFTSTTYLSGNVPTWRWDESGAQPPSPPAFTQLATTSGANNTGSFGMNARAQMVKANWTPAATYSARMQAPATSGNSVSAGLIFQLT